MYVYAPCVCAWSPKWPEEVIRYSETGVADAGQLPCVCWELNPSLLEKQPVPIIAKPSLQLKLLILTGSELLPVPGGQDAMGLPGNEGCGDQVLSVHRKGPNTLWASF